MHVLRQSATPGTCRGGRAAPPAARASASASSSGASGRDQRGSRISTRFSLRPSTSGASWRLIVSTSGSSGIASSAYERARPGSASGASRHRSASAAPSRRRPRADHRDARRPCPAAATRAQHLTGDGEQRRVLARVVGPWMSRVHAVIGGHDQQVALAQTREPVPQLGVDLAQGPVKARTSLRCPYTWSVSIRLTNTSPRRAPRAAARRSARRARWWRRMGLARRPRPRTGRRSCRRRGPPRRRRSSCR